MLGQVQSKLVSSTSPSDWSRREARVRDKQENVNYNVTRKTGCVTVAFPSVAAELGAMERARGRRWASVVKM